MCIYSTFKMSSRKFQNGDLTRYAMSRKCLREAISSMHFFRAVGSKMTRQINSHVNQKNMAYELGAEFPHVREIIAFEKKYNMEGKSKDLIQQFMSLLKASVKCTDEEWTTILNQTMTC